MNAAVFLDRDGVIVRAVVRAGKPHPPDSLAEMEILPGAIEAVRALKRAGFAIVVATNQPDVATGVQRREEVEAMHADLRARMPIDAVKTCFHVDRDGCTCRKPRPGMLAEAARELDLDLGRSYMVGDRWRDVGAAHAAGCAALFIDYGYAERRPEPPYRAAASLSDACALIIGD